MERFWNKVNKNAENGCWEWKGAKTDRGYGSFGVNSGTGKKIWRAHRLSYLLMKGDLIDGMVIDHLCRNITCVNPEHLEQVTQEENMRRGRLKEYIEEMKSKTHCKNGHELDGICKRGWRFCKTCRNEKQNHRRRKSK